MRDEALGQVLDHNAGYREKWRHLTQSKLCFAFVLSFTIWSGCLGNYGLYTIIAQLSGLPADIGALLLEIWAATPVLLGLIVMNVAFWLIRTRGERKQRAGLAILFWAYVALIIMIVLAFVITLPLFTEWIPYQDIYSIPLQIAYCIYFAVGIEAALTIGVIKRMRDNLGFWEGTRGSVVALAVMLILRSLVIWGLSTVVLFQDAFLGVIGLLLMIPMVLLIILLFKYRATTSNIKY